MNRQSSIFQEVSLRTVSTIFQEALHETPVHKAELLGGGLFNTTYLVDYGRQFKRAVLRLGPVNRHLIMGFEQNLMQAEAFVYSICERSHIPCPKILACDTTKTVTDRDFMITEYIPSVSMLDAELEPSQKEQLYIQMGKYLASLHKITGEKFGFVSRLQDGISFSKWSSALIFELNDILSRLEHVHGLDRGQAEAIRALFKANSALFDDIQTPRLLHTDLWEGNILLDTQTFKIKAVIDSDRAVFGDIDFEFAAPWLSNPFIKKGYGGQAWTNGEKNREKRILLYKIFYAVLEAYVGIGEYNNMDLYMERKTQFMELLKNFPAYFPPQQSI